MRTTLTFLFLLFSLPFYGQDLYIQDLDFLKSKLEETKSFKTQISGKKKTAFGKLYQELLNQKPANQLEYINALSKLVACVNDQHLGLYENANTSHFKDKEAFNLFLESREFRDFPSVSLNLDSLEKVLLSSRSDRVVGIYHFNTVYKVGVFPSSPTSYTGVILHSNTPQWIPGQIAFTLNTTKQGHFIALYAQPTTKNFMINTNEKYANQTLLNSKQYYSAKYFTYTKLPIDTVDNVNLSSNTPRFLFEELDNNTDYLLVRTFQKNKKTTAQADTFLDSIPKLGKPNLILDLRNHEGGARSEMKKFHKLIKNYKGKVYVVTNNETLSQAEIFTLKMRKMRKVTVVGQNTKGMLTYGNNYGRRFTLPSGKYTFYPTDMRGLKKHLKYEGIGLQPDVYLDPQQAWLTQITQLMLK